MRLRVGSASQALQTLQASRTAYAALARRAATDTAADPLSEEEISVIKEAALGWVRP